MRKLTMYAAMGLAAASLGLLTGCGNGGGASSEPTVTIKPTESGDQAGGTTAGGASGKAETAAVPAGFGTIKGRILFSGDPPQLGPAVTQNQIKPDDAAVCKAPSIPNEALIVNEGGIANVFFYLDRAPSGVEVPPVPEEPAVFDQAGCLFLQHAFLVRAGQKVLVKSDDPIAHNTHTYPKRNQSFNQTIPPDDRNGVPLVYDKAETAPFPVKCDLHTWMVAYHLPLDHPYAAVTGPDGSFEIPNVPAGTHRFRIWHESAAGGNYLSRNYEVTVKPDETTEVELTYSASDFEL